MYKISSSINEEKKSIYFIGAGEMAEAIIAGLLKSKYRRPELITVTNRKRRERLTQLQARYKVRISLDNHQKISQADTIIFAVKPSDMSQALQQWAHLIRPGQRVITVAAGITTQFVESFLQPGISVIRAMPNTSSQALASATALCTGGWSNPSDLKDAVQLFESIGTTVVVDEKDMDAVTGLSGSGPAYIYYMVEAMEQAGITAGLPKEVAHRLTLQTFLGAAEMLKCTQKKPIELRHKIMSPGGTTVAGLERLQELGFVQIIEHAVKQAQQRSKELQGQFSNLESLSEKRV